jgi:hypothetical protein
VVQHITVPITKVHTVPVSHLYKAPEDSPCGTPNHLRFLLLVSEDSRGWQSTLDPGANYGDETRSRLNLIRVFRSRCQTPEPSRNRARIRPKTTVTPEIDTERSENRSHGSQSRHGGESTLTSVDTANRADEPNLSAVKRGYQPPSKLRSRRHES